MNHGLESCIHIWEKSAVDPYFLSMYFHEKYGRIEIFQYLVPRLSQIAKSRLIIFWNWTPVWADAREFLVKPFTRRSSSLIFGLHLNG